MNIWFNALENWIYRPKSIARQEARWFLAAFPIICSGLLCGAVAGLAMLAIIVHLKWWTLLLIVLAFVGWTVWPDRTKDDPDGTRVDNEQ